MISLDLSDGYYHLRIHPDHQRYFQFRTATGCYQIVALNMGWCLSPGVFTDCLRPMVRHLRKQGVRLLWYLDDFLVCGQTIEETRQARDLVVQQIRALGLTLKQEKCVWEPTRRLVHLGLVVDSLKGEFKVDQKKLDKLRMLGADILAGSARNRRRVAKRKLAAFAGLAQFCAPAVAPARFYLRAIFDCMGTLSGWSGSVTLSRQAQRDIQWWQQLEARGHNGDSIWPPAATILVTTDASPWKFIIRGFGFT